MTFDGWRWSLVHCFPYSGPPNLINILTVVAVEGSTSTVSLSQTPDAFPFPQQFSWTVNRSPARNNSRSFGYPSVTFQSLNRGDTGAYTLTATNYRLDDTSVVVGMDTGSFILDVQCKSIWCSLALSQVPDQLSVQWNRRRPGTFPHVRWHDQKTAKIFRQNYSNC